MDIPNDFFQNLSISVCTKMICVLTDIIYQSLKNGNVNNNSNNSGINGSKIYSQALNLLQNPVNVRSGGTLRYRTV